jgi:hypothetical protein
MNTAKKIYESDEHGVVHVEVPVGGPARRVEVLVVWQDVARPSQDGESDADDVEGEGPSMADLVGLLEGVDLVRPPQGEYEKRDPLE